MDDSEDRDEKKVVLDENMSNRFFFIFLYEKESEGSQCRHVEKIDNSNNVFYFFII